MNMNKPINISAIIIEDEPLAASLLARYIQQYDGLNCEKIAYNAIEASNFLEKNKVDLIFLDIHLPKIKGFDLLDSLKQNYAVILTTAYAQYALDAYEKGVIDYLLKPIEYPRFEKAVERAVEQIELKRTASTRGDFIFVQENKSQIKIFLEDISYIVSDRAYLSIYLHTGHFIRIKSSISDFLSQLNEQFMRIHKSYIINLGRVNSLSLSAVVLEDGTFLTVGRTYRDNLRKVLGNS